MGMFDPHDDNQVVFLQPKLCPNKCGAIVLARDFQSHIDRICPLREELCHEGCGRIILGKELRGHAEICIMSVWCERAELALRERALREVKSIVANIYAEREKAAALHISNGGKLSTRGWPTTKLAERMAKIEAGMNQLVVRCKRKSKDRLQNALALAANTRDDPDRGPQSAMKQLDTLQDTAKFRGARPWDVDAPGLEELLDALEESTVCGGNNELRLQCEAAACAIMRRLLESALLTGDVAILEEVLQFCPDGLKAIELSSLGPLPQLVAEVSNAIHRAALSDVPQNSQIDPEFFTAVKKGDVELCTWLLEREQANPSIVDPKTGLTPLIIATKNDDLNMVQLLLQKGVSVDARCDIDGFTALHWAAHKRAARVMSILLAGRANPRIKDKKGQDALMKLVRRDFKAPAAGCTWSWVMHPHMRLKGAELPGSGMMELEDAKVAAEDTPECVGISFRSSGIGHEPHGHVYISLHGAKPAPRSEQQQQEKESDVQQNEQMRINTDGKCAYVTGSFAERFPGHLKNDPQRLAKVRAQTNSQGGGQTNGKIMKNLPTQTNEPEKELEKEMVEEDESYWTSYLQVATDPAHDVIALLAAGADACAEDNGGLTTLHHHLLSAPSRGSPSIVSSLLRAQADVNAKDSTARSTTPFLLAVSSKKIDLLKLMLTDAWPPAKVDDRTSDGLSALAVAEERGALEVMELLKGVGAQVWSDALVSFGHSENSSFFYDTREPIGLDA